MGSPFQKLFHKLHSFKSKFIWKKGELFKDDKRVGCEIIFRHCQLKKIEIQWKINEEKRFTKKGHWFVVICSCINLLWNWWEILGDWKIINFNFCTEEHVYDYLENEVFIKVVVKFLCISVKIVWCPKNTAS